MSTAEPGTRSFYLDDYSDEVMPCDASLEAWAEWLSKEDPFWVHDVPADGQAFAGSAILWLADILATFDGDEWALSREPDGDFLAVRFSEGFAWDADSICGDRGSLIELLDDLGGSPGQVEHVACGLNENGWRFTFGAGPPPSLLAERVQ